MDVLLYRDSVNGAKAEIWMSRENEVTPVLELALKNVVVQEDIRIIVLVIKTVLHSLHTEQNIVYVLVSSENNYCCFCSLARI